MTRNGRDAYAYLEAQIKRMKLGQAHAERVLRLNKGIREGDRIRGLRITGRWAAHRVFLDLVPKGQVIREFGREFWATCVEFDRQMRDPDMPPHLRNPAGIVRKDGRRKYLEGWMVVNARRRQQEGAA